MGENFSCKTVVGLDQKEQYVSMGHTFGKWFSCFMQGARLRMGMVRRQNEALALQRLEMEDAVCFMPIAFGAGLPGKEVPLVSLKGLLQFWQETCKGSANERYMMMTLFGRFKGEVDSCWHLVPISDRTYSNIPFRL